MFDDRLFREAMELSDVPKGLPLVAGLTGFADAGGVVTQVNRYLLDALESERVGTFNNDLLMDYRARRPVFQFEETHLTSYESPRLSLDLVQDELGSPFLFLSGYEPDFLWETMSQTILGLIESLEVSTSSWVHAIPMPVPHTRSLGVTVSGNREDITDALSVWRPTTGVPGTLMHLIEYRLQEAEHPTAGFVVLVPHYLADTQFPDAAITALQSVTKATGLIFPTDSLRESGREFLTGIGKQVEDNTELEKLIESLEKRHDSYMEDNAVPSPLMDADGEVPSADMIGTELENFLAKRHPGVAESTED
ncbi:PAC2 family protein [Pontimonas sp.]|nr:PAC2 family protein [Pontimonas sp.]MDA8901026.1 PAC2 family protein [Pontimonas sp.]MDA8901033.1 PAC2 family protein [Pontimonas sp.]